MKGRCRSISFVSGQWWLRCDITEANQDRASARFMRGRWVASVHPTSDFGLVQDQLQNPAVWKVGLLAVTSVHDEHAPWPGSATWS